MITSTIEIVQVCALPREHPLYFHYALRLQCVDVRNLRWRVIAPRERFRLPAEEDCSQELLNAYVQLSSEFDEAVPITQDYGDAHLDAKLLAPYVVWGNKTARDVLREESS